jgi:(R,R)-butanediol dehydrogenase/meso-butanediol dehydrogenase/diacetyl reductase
MHMKAVAIEGKCQLKLIDTDQPQATDSKLLIKVERTGICGSDIHMWHNGAPVGLIMGHEFGGTIADPGPAKDMFKAGERVTVLPANPCMECKFCKRQLYAACVNYMADAPGISTPGAYAEYFLANPLMVRRLPDAMSMEEGAMVEPSAVALRAVHLANIQPGDRVLVVGSGIIGLLCAAWARISGAAYVALSELNPVRREKALSYGDVDEVFDAGDPKLQKKLLTATDGGFDKTLECAGPAPAVQSAIGATGYGGTVVLVGVNYDLVPIYTMRVNMREIMIKGSYGYSPEEFDTCIDYIARKALKTDRFVDDIVGLDGVQNAFERLNDPKGDAVKIMVKPY